MHRVPLTRMRLNRWIAQASELSRRAADGSILNGEVSVNGETVTKVGLVINPKEDRVSLRGKILRPPEEYKYLVFNKPRGYLVTKSDPQGRPTIWDLMGKLKLGLNAVGRLDFDSEGLIIITNDGDFLYRLTHPKHEVWKSYRVKVRGLPTHEAIKKLSNGIDLREGRTAPARVGIAKKEQGATWLDFEIREGRYRQIRRMCKSVGYPVIVLKRMSLGPIKLGKLPAGKWRDLSSRELRELMEASAT